MNRYTSRKRNALQHRIEQLEPRQMLTVAVELIADIREGQQGSRVDVEFIEYNGELYFRADDGVVGKELWKTDGTEAGTQLVKDINVGDDAASSTPGWFVEHNGDLYFSAFDENRGDELWKTDGTTSGTVLVKDIYPGDEGSAPSYLTIFNDEIYFNAADEQDNDELWKSDGTAQGTVQVKDIRSTRSSGPGLQSGLNEYNGFIYFDARDNTTGVELWRSDGTAAGTTLVVDADPGDGSSWPDGFTEFNGDLYFTAEVLNPESNKFAAHLFRVDDEAGTAERVTNISVDELQGLSVFGDHLYFAGLGADGIELYRTDGTSEGTMLTRNIMSGINDSNPRNFIEFNGKLYFAAADSRESAGGKVIYNLWATDGTPFGTRKVSSEEIDPSNPFVEYNGELFYSAWTNEAGYELWKTDGTLDGTGMVADVNEGAADSFAIPQRVFDDKLLFLADEEKAGWEIWVYDGESTTMIDTHLGAGDIVETPSLFEFVEFGDDLVYFGSNPFEGAELYIMRSTSEQAPERFAGDADENGKVEFADFLLLSNNFGKQDAVWGDGDFTGDGKIDFADFLLLSDNFGKSAPLPASQIPAGEPEESLAAVNVDDLFATDDDDEAEQQLLLG